MKAWLYRALYKAAVGLSSLPVINRWDDEILDAFDAWAARRRPFAPYLKDPRQALARLYHAATPFVTEGVDPTEDEWGAFMAIMYEVGDELLEDQPWQASWERAANGGRP